MAIIDNTQTYLELSSGGGGYSLESLFGELFIRWAQGEGVIKRVNPRNFFDNKWFGVSNGGEVRVPGLKHKDWWLDLVKDKNDSGKFYAIISHTNSPFNTILILFKNNIEVFSTPFHTGALSWFKIDIEPECNWRFEQWIGDEKIKHVEYTTQQIIENEWSYMEFH